MKIVSQNECMVELIKNFYTSSLDEVNRNKIAENVVKFSRKYGITLMIISHNDEFDKYADKVYEIVS